MKKYAIIAAITLAAVALLSFLFFPRPLSVKYFGKPLVKKERAIAETATTSPAIKEVSYTERGFAPAVTRIKPGGSVVFKNQSKDVLFLVSDATSTVTIAKGKTFRAEMNDVGTLSFSSKQNPATIAIVIVQ